MAAAAQPPPGGPAQGAALGENQSVHGSSETLTPSAVNRLMMEFLIYFGRAVLVFYPVYLTGYLGLSISWVLLCMAMITWWKKNRQMKDARIDSAIEFVDNETHVINSELQNALQMASWVRKVQQIRVILPVSPLKSDVSKVSGPTKEVWVQRVQQCILMDAGGHLFKYMD